MTEDDPPSADVAVLYYRLNQAICKERETAQEMNEVLEGLASHGIYPNADDMVRTFVFYPFQDDLDPHSQHLRTNDIGTPRSDEDFDEDYPRINLVVYSENPIYRNEVEGLVFH
jgi:hypothetical protein